MADTKTFVTDAPIWLDLSSTDAAAARDYYTRLFGWKVEVNPDPNYGGYAIARLAGKEVAGIGPTQTPEGPSAWMVYVGTKDAGETAGKAAAAGGKVLVTPMQVGPQGRMAVIQDPSGAIFGVWEPAQMKGAEVMRAANAMCWAELSARDVDKAIPFYKKVFGWSDKVNDMGPDNPPYHEFQLDGESVGGGMEMDPMVPKDVPSHWLVYFGATDVDATHRKALEVGGTEMMPPTDFPGGRFSIVQDPQGAAFGILSTDSAG